MISVISEMDKLTLTPISASKVEICAGHGCFQNITSSANAPALVPAVSPIETAADETNVSFSNTTDANEEFEIYYFYQTEQLSFLWFLFAMIVLGNSAVVVALTLSKNRKSRMNYFIMHLAIADLTVGMINVLTDIVWRITVAFYGGNIVCKVIKYLQVLVTYSSTYVLVALSIDRYDAITHPMNFSSSWIRARILIASAWGLSAVFSIPAVFLNEEADIRGRPQCWIDLKPIEWQIYITLVAMSLFFIPALIISACYSIIVYTIWTKSKLMAYPKLTKTSNAKGADKSQKNDSELDRKRSSSRGIIPKAKIKTVKMTFVIVFVFILCWSPYFVYDLLQVYGYIPNSQSSIAVSTFIQSLAPLNSAANPIIYCLFSTRICRNLRRISIFDWLARHLCPLSPCGQQSAAEGTTVTRFSESTTMTESTANRSYSRCSPKQQIHLTTRPSDMMILKKHIVDKQALKNGSLDAPGNYHV